MQPMNDNHYTLGRTGSRNMVFTRVLSGLTGSASTTNVVSQMLPTILSVRRSALDLVVGIGGGAPSPENDLRLDDVVTSEPIGHF